MIIPSVAVGSQRTLDVRMDESKISDYEEIYAKQA
jgi:hypothetical protein